MLDYIENGPLPNPEEFTERGRNVWIALLKEAEYLEEKAKTSLPELIIGNFHLATRYFNNRVKKFINIVVMGTNNPMFVNYHTEKVEFQDRGAGHIHGTLWLKLNMIERLVKLENGELALGNKQDLNTSDKGHPEYSTENYQEQIGENETGPFKGITSASIS